MLLSGHKWPLGMIINCMGHFHMKSQQPYYFVFQNSEKVAMFQTNSVGGELFSLVNASFVHSIIIDVGHVSENALYPVMSEHTLITSTFM